MKLLVACLLLACLGVPVEADARNGAPQLSGVFEKVSEIRQRQLFFGSPGVVFRSDSIDLPTEAFARLGVRIRGSKVGSLAIRFYDGGGFLVSQIGLANAGEIGWTAPIQKNSAYFEIVGRGQPGMAGLVVEIYRTYRVPPGEPQNIVEPPAKWEQAYEFDADPRLHSASKSVSILSLYVNAIRLPGYCSGFMISSKYLVTNDHCVPDQATCRTVQATFGYRRDRVGITSYGQSYSCAKYLPSKAAKAADLSILEMAGDPGSANNYGFLRIGSKAVVGGQPLMIIGYPSDNPEIVTRRLCEAGLVPAMSPTVTQKIDFAHACDTDEGSSGSPVLSADLELVGIHHWGFEKDDPIWARANRAVSAVVLLQVIKELNLAIP